MTMKLMRRGRSGRKAMMRETMRTMKSLPKMNMGKPTTKDTMGLTKGAIIRRPIKLHISLHLDNMIVATVFRRMSLDFWIPLILFDVLVFHNDMFVPVSQTLPKAQRTRGLSSYHKITVHSS